MPSVCSFKVSQRSGMIRFDSKTAAEFYYSRLPPLEPNGSTLTGAEEP